MVNDLKKYGKKQLKLANIGMAFFLFILLFEALENNKLIIGIETSIFIILILIYLNILLKNSTTFHVDIRLSLILGYSFYNLYTPIVYCFRKAEILSYGSSDIGWEFNSNDVQISLFISILFLAGLLLALTFVKNVNVNVTGFANNKYLVVKKNIENNFYLWLAAYIISFAWYVYPYTKIGFEVINYDRSYRYEFLFSSITNELGIINTALNFLSNNYLILISLFMMFKSIVNNRCKLQRIIFIGISSLYTIFILFVDLRRRELLIIILMCISYYFYKIKDNLSNKQIKKLLKKILFSLLILLVFFMAYQQYRDYFKSGYTEGISAMANMKAKESNNESEIYLNEFGMVYLTNLSSGKYPPKLFYGKSYIEALLKPIPFVSKMTYEWLEYDKDKDVIELWLSNIYTRWFTAGGGLGYSPASEAFVNFGYIGCLIIGFIIGLLLNLLYRNLYKDKYIVIYSILFSLTFLFSRTDFYGFTYEFFWLVFYYIFYSSVFKIIRSY